MRQTFAVMGAMLALAGIALAKEGLIMLAIMAITHLIRKTAPLAINSQGE
jgi:hypothetical protein